MEYWDSLIDQQLRKLIDDGQFQNLPGEGKPLNLDDDSNTPSDSRMAFKIMKDNDIHPPWITEAKEIDSRREAIHKQLNTAIRAYKGALNDAVLLPNADRVKVRDNAEKRWQMAQHQLLDAAATLNRLVLNCNLKLPQGIKHKAPINIEKEIAEALRRSNLG